MKPKDIKALAEKKYPDSANDANTIIRRDQAIQSMRRAYEQGLRAGIKLAKQKKDERENN